MSNEEAFHKLGKVDLFDTVLKEGFMPSVPAVDQWLGEGVYFFLNPSGYYWAKRWPFSEYNARTDSAEGIIHTTLQSSLALDFRDDEIRNKTAKIVGKLKLRLKFNGLPYSDGAAFAYIFREQLFTDIVKFVPTALIADFDVDYEPYRGLGGKVFLNVEKAPKGRHPQVQACVLDQSIIGPITLCKA